MYESTTIWYNGVSSASLGLLFVRFDNADNTETFLSGREIISDKIQKSNSHKSQTYLYGVERKPRTFTAEFYCDNFDDAKKSQVARWLNVESFAPFYSSENVDKIYYCMLEGEPKFKTNGTQGIVSVEMTCQDEYSYSAVKTKFANYSETVGDQYMTVSNDGDVKTSPVITIKIAYSGTTIAIINESNSNQVFTLATDGSGNQLIEAETIVIDCNREIITTDRVGVFRYDNFSGSFLDLALGTNTLKITGNCEFTVAHQNKYLT